MKSPSGIRRLLGSAVLGCLVAAAPTAGKPAVSTRVHWTGRSGGYDWRWASSDVTASRGGKPVLSLRRGLKTGDDFEGLTVFRVHAQPLSVVGSLLSYRQDEYWEGGAHPSGSISYVAVDAARPTRPVKLTDLFPDRAVRDALWSDRIVRRVLQGSEAKTPPRTAAELAARLKHKSFGGEMDAKYAFTPDLLSQFALHHLEGDRVAVRLCVPWNAEIFRFQSTELGLLLPVPERLREPLRRAAAGREGFLAREGRKRFGEASSLLFEWSGSGTPP